MEENKKKKKGLLDFTTVLSFAVAFFAIFSLVAVGFNQISYAAPVFDDSFTFNTMKGSDGRPVSVVGKDANNVDMFTVNLYFSDAAYTKPIFCIERSIDVGDGLQYTKGDAINDYGLLYLLNNSFSYGNSIPNSNKYIDAWATQVAIWFYLNETQPGVSAYNWRDSDNVEAIKKATIFSVLNDPSSTNDINFGYSIYDRHIRPLVDAAKSASSLKQITVTKDDGEIVKTSDGKFYQTPLITVIGDPSSDLVNYDINLEGIDGAFAIDENGNNLETKNVSAGQKFYVRIPSDKVTNSVQNLNINVTGHFKSLAGNIYISGNYQKVVSVYDSIEDVGGGLSIEVVGAPDTGMNSAQTIYFIGLVVLLCGVGIIYANAKPVEVKQ